MRFFSVLFLLPLFVSSQNEQRFVTGTVKELGTNQLIPNSTIHVSGSDGSSFIAYADSIGKFVFPLKEGVTFQLQAESDNSNHPCDKNGIKSRRYYSSEKELIGFNDNGEIVRDLYLEVIQSCYKMIPELFFQKEDSNLNQNHKIKLNGLIETLNDNPTITIKLNVYNVKGSVVKTIQSYLMSKGIDKRRIGIDSTTYEPFTVFCSMEWNYKSKYPDLNDGLEINFESINNLNPKSKEFVSKYLYYVGFRITSTDFKP